MTETQALPRVRWATTPIDGQSLSGLTVATAGENGHRNIDVIRSFAGIGGGKTIGQAARDATSRNALARVLDLPEDEIELRAHPLTEPIGRIEAVDFFGARVPASDVLLGRRRLGDTSKGGHHKAIWQFIHLPIDRSDGAVITDRCRSCGAALDWRHIAEEGACGNNRPPSSTEQHRRTAAAPYDCRARGARANDDPQRVDAAHRGRIALLCELIDPDPAVHKHVLDALHPDLAKENRGTVFYLGLKLGRALGLENGGSRLSRGVPAPLAEALRALETGSALIASWPHGVGRVIVEIATADRERALAAIAAVRRVCHGEGAWPEHRLIINRSLPDIMTGRHQHAIRRLMPEMVDGLGARGITGLRSHDMARLIRARAIEAVVSRGSDRIHGSFMRSDMEGIAAAIAGSMDASSVAEDLGTTLHGVEQLVCRTLLERAEHPALLALRTQLQVTRSSHASLRDALLGDDVPRSIEDGIPLRRALLRIGGREKPWAAIFEALLTGRLRYAVTAPAGRVVDRISVERGEKLAAVLNATFSRDDHTDFPFARMMSQRDAIELLNIDPPRFQEIAPLVPHEARGPGKSLKVQKIVGLAGSIIDQREARARWNHRLERRTMIEGGIGWDRTVVEADRGGSLPASQREFEF